MTTFKELRNRIKAHKNELAKTIRDKKKEGYRYFPERREFRMIHIASCEFFRGKTREQIEKPGENNELTSYHNSLIENYKSGWKAELEENA